MRGMMSLLLQTLELTITLLPAGRESFHALYYKDGIHPSAIGTYLESCVMSSVISGEEYASSYQPSPCYDAVKFHTTMPADCQATYQGHYIEIWPDSGFTTGWV